ncbi:MAG: glycoside hydrolase family 2 TIM barrel-domain containing protein [Armatimonadaceae bacterium]
MKQILFITICLIVFFINLPFANAQDKATIVKVVERNGEWQLLRDGKPYFVRGAGGSQNLELLTKSGGNSLRTWGAENAGKDLDLAQKHGLTLTLGIWLGHKQHGFKYDDPQMVKEQFEKAKEVVLKYRNHPALLAWGIGNEMEGDGNDPLVWKAIEDIARMVKELDPNHPTMTVIAEIGGEGIKAKQVQKLCPSIDILGVNSYGGASSVATRLKQAGFTKPYIVTEFGPNGPWEVGKTPWGAALEPNSTEKTRMYLNHYQQAVAAQPGWCLGSYVFLWSHKQEATPTWFGMFLPETGEKLGPVDAMALAWTGKAPTGRAPEIVQFSSSLGTQEIAPGSRHTAACHAWGNTAGDLTYRYEIRPDETGSGSPEPGQVPPPAIAGIIPPEGKSGSISFQAPSKPGPYRLYVYVRDGNGGAATANVPFLVK